jgi:hypothetical protein
VFAVGSLALGGVGNADNSTAAITVQTTSSAGQIFIAVMTLGDPPTATAEAPIRLVNAQGQNTSVVQVLNSGDTRCRGADVRFAVATPVATSSLQKWCLDIAVPATGSQVSGTVNGSQTTLTLNVQHQTALTWPIVYVVAGLVLAVLIVFFSPANVGGLIRRFRLGASIADNESRQTRGIRGLNDHWRRDARTARVDTTSIDFVGSVVEVVKNGSAREDAARAVLQRAVAVTKLPAHAAVVDAALREAEREDYVVGDFFDGDFTVRELPASVLASQLAQAEAIQERLIRAHTRVPPEGQPGHDNLTDEVDRLERELQRTRPEHLADLTHSVETLESDLLHVNMIPADQIAAVPTLTAFAGPGAFAAVRLLRQPGAVAVPGPAVLAVGVSPEARRFAWTALGRIVQAVAFIPMLVAGATTFATTYLANKTFGTVPDYLTLTLAAVGTSAATGAVAGLLLWRSAATPPSGGHA